MDLILWRHAEAEESKAGLSDMKRRLTPRGEKQARVVGRWLRRQLPKGARILVSPSMRTQQTVLPLDLPYDTDDRIGPGATPSDLLAAAGWPNPSTAVVIVGHQPTLGALASLLVCGKEEGFSVRKGSIWWISRKNKPGDDGVFLRAVIGPDML
ncbi:MAG: histidine phosphatase family protein [Gammaproteobacteria bacterium]|nr:histidine phosphatase family protein [Gammaproteobacteria bacterium]MBU1647212.1 histidine phosphatase family protein [Gammaproteobacteria bacterium]MBU1972724.1 histidine phosphatase family protein [Gammaproteobacteria bacterium]